MLGPEYYNTNGIWTLKPYYLGSWTLRAINPKPQNLNPKPLVLFQLRTTALHPDIQQLKHLRRLHVTSFQGGLCSTTDLFTGLLGGFLKLRISGLRISIIRLCWSPPRIWKPLDSIPNLFPPRTHRGKKKKKILRASPP